jgi:hypothetical protein
MAAARSTLKRLRIRSISPSIRARIVPFPDADEHELIIFIYPINATTDDVLCGRINETMTTHRHPRIPLSDWFVRRQREGVQQLRQTASHPRRRSWIDNSPEQQYHYQYEGRRDNERRRPSHRSETDKSRNQKEGTDQNAQRDLVTPMEVFYAEEGRNNSRQ